MFDPPFLLTSLIIVLIPGTGVIYTVSTAISCGKRAGFYAALGCTLGIVPHLLATVCGLAALMHAGALTFQLLKYAGAAYLIYLAVSTWRNNGMLSLKKEKQRLPQKEVIFRGILLNILNPKLTLFFLAFLPQFIPSQATNATTLLIELSAVFMGMTFAIFVLYGFLGNAFRKTVVDSPVVQKHLNRTFAGIFALLGCKLAFSGE